MESMKITYYRHNIYGHYYSIPKRYNEASELTLVFKGNLHYVINDTHYHLKEGDILYVESGTYTSRLYDNKPADYVSFNFSTVNSGEYFKTGIMESAITKDIKSIITLCDNTTLNKTENYLEKENNLASLLILTIKDNLSLVEESEKISLIKKYVASHISEKITLNDIADYIFFSPSYCDTLFKKEVGTPIISYVLNAKIDYAKRLLSEGVSLKDASNEVGFSDYNYFSRLFKKKVGCSPQVYKKNLL